MALSELEQYRWMRADLKWHRYEPCPTVPTIEDFIAAIDEDSYGCFFG